MTEGERKNMKQDTLEGRAKTKNGVKRLCFSVVCILLEAAFIIAMLTKLNQYAEIVNLMTRLLAGVLVLKLYASDQTSSMKMTLRSLPPLPMITNGSMAGISLPALTAL